MKPHVNALQSTGPWPAGFLKFADRYPDLVEVWSACEDPACMLTWIGRSVSRDSQKLRKLVLVAALCAKRELPVFEKSFPNDARVRNCLEAIDAWLAKSIDLNVLREKLDLSSQAGATATFDREEDARNAAMAVNFAARIACNEKYGIQDASTLAHVIGNIGTPTEQAVKMKRKKMAGFIRGHYPLPPTLNGVENGESK